ncbi:MAG: hypothetical protein ABI587_02015 [Gemmatimonadales bacterium]
MVRISSGTITVALAGCLIAAALGLTTYTRPLEGASSDPDLVGLLRAALHDSSPSLPAVSNVLPVQAIPDSDGEAQSLVTGRPDTVETDSSIAPGAQTWVASAAAADPAALRDWLGRWVWATAVTDGDTLRLTLHRLSFHSGCPWISRLDAVTTRSADFAPRLIRVTGTCPAIAR